MTGPLAPAYVAGVPSRRTLEFVRLLLDTVVLRFAWALLGAILGIYGFVALGYLLPGLMKSLDAREIGLASGGSLPMLALAWLACAALGTTGFTIAWSALLAAVTRRLHSEE